MKFVMRIILVLMIFFTSLAVQAHGVGNFHVKNSAPIIIENYDTKIANYDNFTNQEFVTQNNSSQEFYISNLKNNSNSGFGAVGNKYCPVCRQFSLMISYMYSKSYFLAYLDIHQKPFLTEIHPNAPSVLFA